MEVEVKIHGLQELEARLLELDALGGEKLLRRVLTKIAKPMKLAAQANAQSISKHGSSGALARSIAVVRRTPQGKAVARVAVTSVSKNKVALYLHNAFYQRKRKGIFYGWMLERGHRTGTSKTGYLRKTNRRSGGYAGAVSEVQRRPWWGPAVSSTEGRATTDFVSELTKAVARMERRKSKQASPDALVPP